MKTYNRVYARIDLDAIRDNLVAVRNKVPENVRVMAVIKSDAYGHGAVTVADYVDDVVDGYCVAVVEEGMELRRSGITKPMLILGYTDPYQYPDALRNDLTMTVFQYDAAEKLSDLAIAMDTKARVHIKLDTGMGRIGFRPDRESLETVKKICALPGITVEGIFTHFAKADMKGREFTDMQFQRFCGFVKDLENEGINIPVKHVANSAAIMEYPDTYLDQVRSGIITYGLYPSDEVDQSQLKIRPAMELKSHIVYIKKIKKGDSIGYGGTYVADGERIIGTVPVGYGDGYPRNLSNKGSILVHGRRAPIVGRICMDQFMVDITDIPEAREGDTVTLMGTDENGSFLSCEEISELAGSFNYEFCCDVGRRVPRVYMAAGRVYKTVNYVLQM